MITLISCIIGIGTVSVPFGLGAAGFFNGILINLFVMGMMMISSHLYVTAIDYFGVISLSELCYMSMGRSSIYIVNGFMAFIFFFVLVIYNI